MHGRSFSRVAIAAIALTAGAAFAQAVEEEEITIPVPEVEEERPPVQVQLNGGVAGYTGELGDSSDTGALYGVLGSAQVLPQIGVEAGYEGTRNVVTDGFGSGTIWRHNASAMVKGGPVLLDESLQPFVGVGLGISYVNASDEAEATGFRNDVMEEIPLAAGVEYRLGAFVAGARGTYRVLVNDEFAEPTPEADNPGGGLLSGQITLGGRF